MTTSPLFSALHLSPFAFFRWSEAVHRFADSRDGRLPEGGDVRRRDREPPRRLHAWAAAVPAQAERLSDVTAH
jgi:hypothetical protein